MSVAEEGREVDREETLEECGAETIDAVTPTDEPTERPTRRARMPWIGALPNPILGPMVVLNESGYLVPLLTSGDLLRGCKYFWRESQA